MPKLEPDPNSLVMKMKSGYRFGMSLSKTEEGVGNSNGKIACQCPVCCIEDRFAGKFGRAEQNPTIGEWNAAFNEAWDDPDGLCLHEHYLNRLRKCTPEEDPEGGTYMQVGKSYPNQTQCVHDDYDEPAQFFDSDDEWPESIHPDIDFLSASYADPYDDREQDDEMGSEFTEDRSEYDETEAGLDDYN